MDSIEIIVYIGVAMLVGGLFLFAMHTTDWNSLHRKAVKTFVPEDEIDFKISYKDFPVELAKRWEDCRYGMVDNTYAVYVTDNGTIDYDYVVKELRRVDKCDIIDCRNRTNQLIVNGTTVTPKIINIRCLNNTLLVNSR